MRALYGWQTAKCVWPAHTRWLNEYMIRKIKHHLSTTGNNISVLSNISKGNRPWKRNAIITMLFSFSYIYVKKEEINLHNQSQFLKVLTITEFMIGTAINFSLNCIAWHRFVLGTALLRFCSYKHKMKPLYQFSTWHLNKYSHNRNLSNQLFIKSC